MNFSLCCYITFSFRRRNYTYNPKDIEQSEVMDFDPLSYFEPDEALEVDVQSFHTENLQESNSTSNIENSEEANTLDDVPLQILDLPYIGPATEIKHLITILKLFKSDQLRNFAASGSENEKETSISERTTNPGELEKYLSTKDITLKEFSELSCYLNHTAASVLSLVQLPTTFPEQTTAYLTKIISYPFPQLEEEERDHLYDFASYIMTSNSAPALKGNTTRLVEMEGLSSGIKLYEPALTEDKVGNLTWGASLELSKLLLNPTTSITPRWIISCKEEKTPILELGAGTGLVSIVLAKHGYSIISTDLPEIVENLTKNIQLNNVQCSTSDSNESFDASSISNAHTTSLDWRNPSEFLIRSNTLTGFKTLIFSDPVYSEQHPYWVSDTVSATLSKERGSKVIFMVGRRERFEDVRDDLWRLMNEIGLEEICNDVIDGKDDYGALIYDYKVFGRI